MLKLINDRNKEDHRRGDAVLKDDQILKINMDVFQVHKLKGFWDKVLKKTYSKWEFGGWRNGQKVTLLMSVFISV